MRTFEEKGLQLITSLANQFIECFEEQNRLLKTCFEEQNTILLNNLPHIIAEEVMRVRGLPPNEELSQEEETEGTEEETMASGFIEDLFDEEYLDEELDFGDIV